MKILEADHANDKKKIEQLRPFLEKMLNGMPFRETTQDTYARTRLRNTSSALCFNCNEYSIWVASEMIYPRQLLQTLPNLDMPEPIKLLFNEARAVVELSPRSAAAILRLCVQHLCKELGESGKNINNDISSLVKKGLDPIVQQSLDIVRVIGNESVHPGEFYISDDRETADQLFSLVNFICEQMISTPKKVGALYDKLPKEKRVAIENRDKKTSS